MEIRLENISKIFVDKEKRETRAVDNFTAHIGDGKLVGLLGPSGCGKSTTLFMIAGLHNPTTGKIFFDDDDITLLAPEKRGIGLVFQNYALYPHMTVRQNIMFPLENENVPKEEAMDRAQEIADLVGIGNLMERKPGQLSGGQQQRVAIARALVKKPRVLLLDEPLSNLDARLRLQMREEIKRIQKETKITTVFVTHDQEEAMSICDEIILMELGVEQQKGIPQAVYDDPVNLFVAKFLGTPSINLYNAEIKNNKLYVNGEEVLDTKKAKISHSKWAEFKEDHPITEQDNSEVIIKVSGSPALKEATEAALEAFSKIAGNFKYEFNLTGSNDAYDYTQGVKRNHKQFAAQLGISSRPLVEEERGVRRYIKQYLIDAPSVVVNKENKLDNVTSEELIKIITGQMTEWPTEGEEANTINVYMLDEKSGTKLYLLNKLGIRRRKVSRKITLFATYEELLNHVESNPNAIGVMPFTAVTDQVKLVKVDDVSPSVDTLKDGSFPFAVRGVILGRTIAHTPAEELAMAFLDFIKVDEGAKVLANTNAIIPEKSYLLGVRPEGYQIDQTNGVLTVNIDYYESVGRDVSLVCRHEKAETPTYRIILPEVKEISKLNLDKGVKFSLNPKKVYVFDKETGERVI